MTKLKVSDLKSAASLKEWINANSNIFINKEISKDNMLIIIDYLYNYIKNGEESDKSIWLQLIRDIKKRVEAQYE